MSLEKFERLGLQELRLAQFDRKRRNLLARELAFSVARLDAMLDQPVVILAEFPFLDAGFISIFDRLPLGESMLRIDFIAQMPLAKISRSIIRIGEQFWKARDVRRQRDAVMHATALVRPQTRHHAGARRRADRLRDI